MGKNLLLAALMSSALATGAYAADPEVLTVGGYGGSFEIMMKKLVIPAFEKEHNVKVAYVSGNSTENLARLQAQKGAQELDVVILDDGPMYQADALGFCAPLEKTPIKDDVYDLAQFSPNAIGMGFVATGFAYSKEFFEKEGWDLPTSWEDLKDPKYEGLISVPPISNTYGLHALVMLARNAGGGEKDIDPGFAAMADEVAPNVLVFEPSSGKMSELFQNGEIAFSVWGSGRVASLANTGYPVDFIYPKEGAVALMLAGCPVVDSNVPEEAQAFIDYLLQPEIQVQLGEAMGSGPVNKKTVLPPKLAESLPYGEKISKLVNVDWDVINPLRQEWTARWAREVER